MQCPASASARMLRPSSGFSLIELMIAIVVMAVLAAIAFPSYMGSVRKGRRSEAISALTWIQQAEERFRSNNTQYTTNMAAPPAPANAIPAPPSGSGYYTYSVDYADAAGTIYIASATATAGMSQADDTNCAVMRLQIVGGTVSYGSCQAGCPVALPQNGVLANLTDAGKCWSR